MGLTSLNTAISGLSIAQRQIEVISNNVANVGTEGYTRKILPQNAQVVDNLGSGVYAGVITRNVDTTLLNTMWTQTSTLGKSQVMLDYLQKVEQFHGAADTQTSISSTLTDLKDSFSALSDDPTNQIYLAQTLAEAQDTAQKFNDLAEHITTLRNDAQNEVSTTISEINSLLNQIADANIDIVRNTNLGKTTAASEDLRDQTITELASYVDVNTFARGDGAVIVQTNQGIELAGRTANELTFSSNPLGVSSYYPEGAGAIYVGDPNDSTMASFNITETEPGGKLGGLITLRDETFPQQMAQLDELAHKMARRFESQGLQLFVDGSGGVPGDTAPDPTTDPPTPVPYIGFATSMRVNQAVINDYTLLQKGTVTNAATGTGSNTVINRILENAFGTVSYQTALGNIDLDLSSNVSPNDTLQGYLGLKSTATVESSLNLGAYNNATEFLNATNNAIGATNGTVRFRFEEADLSLGPIDIDVDISAVPDGAGDFVQDIIDQINTQIAAMSAADQTALSDMGVNFSQGTNGGLKITSNSNITTDSTSATNPIGDSNLIYLGLSAETTESEDPYFDVAVGNNNFTRITIEPGDDHDDLITKLNNVADLAAKLDSNGYLQIRPGNSYSDPGFGGNLTIVGGPFETDSAGVGSATMPDNIAIVSALFGSFTAGSPPQSNSPITSVSHGSSVSASDSTSVSFRQSYLGPNAAISTEIPQTATIIDFVQQMLNQQSSEISTLESELEDDSSFLDLVQQQSENISGVNVDEELSNLIVVQTAYSASARVISAVEELFDELIQII